MATALALLSSASLAADSRVALLASRTSLALPGLLQPFAPLLCLRPSSLAKAGSSRHQPPIRLELDTSLPHQVSLTRLAQEGRLLSVRDRHETGVLLALAFTLLLLALLLVRDVGSVGLRASLLRTLASYRLVLPGASACCADGRAVLARLHGAGRVLQAASAVSALPGLALLQGTSMVERLRQ